MTINQSTIQQQQQQQQKDKKTKKQKSLKPQTTICNLKVLDTKFPTSENKVKNTKK